MISGPNATSACSSAGASNTSHTTGCAPSSRRPSAFAGVRVIPATSWPSATSSGTSRIPITPLAPATKIRIRSGTSASGAGGRSVRPRPSGVRDPHQGCVAITKIVTITIRSSTRAPIDTCRRSLSYSGLHGEPPRPAGAAGPDHDHGGETPLDEELAPQVELAREHYPGYQHQRQSRVDDKAIDPLHDREQPRHHARIGAPRGREDHRVSECRAERDHHAEDVERQHIVREPGGVGQHLSSRFINWMAVERPLAAPRIVLVASRSAAARPLLPPCAASPTHPSWCPRISAS